MVREKIGTELKTENRNLFLTNTYARENVFKVIKIRGRMTKSH